MKRSVKIVTFLLSLVAITMVGAGLLAVVDAHFVGDGSILQYWPAIPVVKTVMQFVPERFAVKLDHGVFGDNAIKILFARTVEEQLFPKNEFYMKSVDDGQFVQETGTGAEVVYPVAGNNPNVEKNRTQLPAQITKRVDDENRYSLDEFTTDPTAIQYTEDLIVNYSKRASVLRNHVEALNTAIADTFVDIWLPDGAANIVRTTGAARPAGSPGATGNRKKLTEADIIRAAEIFDKMPGVTHTGRYCVLPAEMIADLRGIDNFKRQDAYGSSNIPDGVIARIHGFWVFSREYVGRYTNAGTPVKKLSGQANATSDNLAALFWHEQMVNRAKSGVKAFTDEDKPEYYGSVFSFLCRAGGKHRKDKKGVLALVEDHD